MELFVQYHEICNHSYHSGEQWGDWSESYDFSVRSVSATSRETYNEERFNVPFDVTPGDPVFVLWMTYDTGDSFGRATGKGEVIWVFKDPTVAYIAYQKWQDVCAKKEYSVTFKVENDVEVQLSNPASGYFENAGYVSLDSYLVNP